MPLKPLLLWALVALAAAGPSQAGQSQAGWTRAASASVEVYTDSGRGAAARILAETLRFHAACARVYGLGPEPPPVKVVFFSSEADFRQFRGESYSKGFFERTGDEIWIVVHDGPDSVRRLRHELVHLLNDEAGLSFAPAWLNEGLAEYWSALDADAASTGQYRSAPILNLLQLLSATGAFSANDLNNARQDSDQALFYARSWLLVRRLIEEGGMERVRRLGALLAGGEDSASAFRLLYGAGMETMLARAQALSVPGAAAGGWVEKGWPSALNAGETELSSFDAEIMLGELASSTGAASESQRRYEKALAAAGHGPDSRSRLAMVALRRGDRAEALRLMDAAARAGTQDARMWFEYAILLRDSSAARDALDGRDAWINAARRAAELDPERAEAWFVLGSALEGDESIQALARAANSSQSRSWMWEAYGRALLKVGRKDEARTAAREALKRARRSRERLLAEGLLADIDAQPPPSREGLSTVTPGGWTKPVVTATIEGRLVDVDCSGRSPVLVIDTGSGKTRISVQQTSGPDLPANMQFTCGPQPSSRPAVFGHDAQPDPGLRSTGDLRSIRFK